MGPSIISTNTSFDVQEGSLYCKNSINELPAHRDAIIQKEEKKKAIHTKFHEKEETHSNIKRWKTHKQNGSLINLAVYFKKDKYTRN
jgi:hypothetical protein